MEILKRIFVVLLVLGPACWFGYLGKTAEMGLAIVASSIAAAFINLDKFQKFKGAGFEAELKKAVEEAYATINQLRKLGKPVILTLLNILTYHNRLSGMKPAKSQDFLKELELIANELSLGAEKEIVEAKREFIRFKIWDHYSRFIYKLQEGIPDTQIEKTKVIENLRKCLEYDRELYPSRKLIMDIIGECKLTSEAEEYLEDYLFYIANHELRSDIEEL